MTMADFDSLFADNLRDFQPVMMQTHYTARDNIGRARSSGGNMDRTGSGSPNPFHPSLTPPLPRSSIKSQHRASSTHSHRRQRSSGAASTVNLTGQDPFSEISMNEIWGDQNGSPNGSPGPADAIPLQSDQLLSFRTFHRNNVIMLDNMGNPINMNMAAQLHGMFFLAESPWDANGGPALAGSANTPKELTCYRRNLFQVSGSIALPTISEVLVGDGDSEITMDSMSSAQRRMIHSLEASISGIENVEHSPVKIITVPWKNAATAPASQTPQQQPAASNDEYPPTANNSGRPFEKEPAPLFFNYPPAYYANPNGIPPEEDDGDLFKWQLNWKRLQFRSATANNGRRKDLQQHFLVKLSIYATLFPQDGGVPNEKLDKVLLCEAFSNAIIVRGRSPRNFSSRNDIPLTGSAIVSSRHTHNSTVNAQIMASAAKKARHMSTGSNEEDSKHDIIYQTDISPQYSSDYLLDHSTSMPHLPTDLNFSGDIYGPQTNWMDPTGSLPLLHSQAALMQSQFFDPSGSYTNLSDPGASRVNLTGLMYGDEFTPPSTQAMFSNQSTPITTMGSSMPPPSMTHRSTVGIQPRVTTAQSPSMDLLYEYFPIGLDDYMPPVEVVYRPHNAHHQTQLPPSNTSTRSKRLFSETPFE
ncbi:hypothetical protein H072_9552 [Dactylellina haptotyla CBS 200.50]|uniref:NDT80 domain-containing protein n=1 Tax=Dactylellina haptotyla (strain CBS 200.50) TaxID=1284197 RepID=S8BCJ3_DACHA|nr:hypothetical protein H072_9552 [Dactylellina haptotyla CBS 200.50]